MGEDRELLGSHWVGGMQVWHGQIHDLPGACRLDPGVQVQCGLICGLAGAHRLDLET